MPSSTGWPGGLLMVVVSEGVADRLGAALTAVLVVDYPITHLVLAWHADQAHAAPQELVRRAQGLALQAVSYLSSQGAGGPGAPPRD